MYRQALTGYEKKMGPDHTCTLGTIHNMGNLYSYQGRINEAEKMLYQELVEFKKKLGPDHIAIQGIIDDFAIFYWSQGKLEEAEGMCRQVLAAKKKLFGPNDLSTLGTVGQLAILCSKQGKLEEAEKMLCQALAGHIRVGFSSDRASSRITVFNFGSSYISQGRINEAEGMYCQVLVKMEKSLGRDHPTTLKVVDILDDVRNFNTLEDEEDKQHQKRVVLQKLKNWVDREQPGKWLSVESDGKTQQAATRSDALVKPSKFHTWQVVFCALLTALTAWFLAYIF